MDEVVTVSLELEGDLEGQVGSGAGVEVQSEHRGGVGHNGLDLHCVDKGLRQSSGLQGGVVEAIDVVPDWIQLAW